MDVFGPVLDMLYQGLGVGEDRLSLTQMLLRSCLAYLFAIALVRFGHKRFLGRHTAFDAILGFILGSVLSRAVTGNAPLGPALAASAMLVAIHWLFAVLSFRSDRFARLVNGQCRVLVCDGEVNRKQMRSSQISLDDLKASLRMQGSTDDLSDVRLAILELDGSVSVLKRSAPPKVVEVKVEEGVQTVRIRLG